MSSAASRCARAHAKRPARVLVAIESAALTPMDAPFRSRLLHPARSLAAWTAGAVTELALDVHFSRRLGEREVAVPERVWVLPKNLLAKCVSVALRSTKLTPSSIARPSIWSNIGHVMRRKKSRRYASRTRILIGGLNFALSDLHGRSVRPQHHFSTGRACREVERGMIGRKFDAVKLYHSVSASGPRAIVSELAEDVLDLFDH